MISRWLKKLIHKRKARQIPWQTPRTKNRPLMCHKSLMPLHLLKPQLSSASKLVKRATNLGSPWQLMHHRLARQAWRLTGKRTAHRWQSKHSLSLTSTAWARSASWLLHPNKSAKQRLLSEKLQQLPQMERRAIRKEPSRRLLPRMKIRRMGRSVRNRVMFLIKICLSVARFGVTRRQTMRSKLIISFKC